MALMRKNVIDNHANTISSDRCVPQVTLKSWSDLIHYMGIDPVEFPWNVDGVTALRIFRDKYGKTMHEINDPYLDEVMQNYAGECYSRQIYALSTAMDQLGLIFCSFNNGTKCYYFIRKEENRAEWSERLSSLKLGRRAFSSIPGDSLEDSTNHSQIPMSMLQVTDTLSQSGTDDSIIEHFLVIRYDTYEPCMEQPIKKVRVYDLRYWPMRPLEKVSFEYDRNHIEPYSLEIETECGEKYCYVGDDIHWYKTVESEHGELIPVYQEDVRVNDGITKLGESTIQKTPRIADAHPLIVLDDRIIYDYTLQDIDHLNEEDESYFVRYRDRQTLIEYHTKTKRFRKLNFPGTYALYRRLHVYKNTWLVLQEFGRDSSYILRFWNPRTHECFRLTRQDIGNHDIESIIPTPNGELLFLLDGGCLCHPDVDLIAWFRQDELHHRINLQEWQDELRRSYENFPDMDDRSLRRRRVPFYEGKDTDHMLITFNDGMTYEIRIKESGKA